MSLIDIKRSKENEKKAERAKELAKIKIVKEDVELIVSQIMFGLIMFNFCYYLII
jgi:hypothetical protein